jgi:glycerate 2-kinase
VEDFRFVRVLVCPDKFAGTLSATEAAEAIAAGWREAAPGDHVMTLPLSDGGTGFLEVLGRALDGPRLSVPAWDPLGRPVAAEVLVAGLSAYVESAQTCGLHLLAPAERDPLRASSYGLGAPVAAAVESGVREIVVGLGGTATNDAGAGLLATLGAAPLDRAGYALPPGGAALAACAGLAGVPRLRGTVLVAATDVDNPLTGPLGASAVFGPQKGAGDADVARLDAALGIFAEVLQRSLPTCPPGLAQRPGAGAAGGLGAAILACGGRCESGFGLVRRLLHLDAALAECDLAVTGEGSLDEQSLRGKVVAGVAAAAGELGRPCAVLAGRVRLDPAAARAVGISEAHSLVEAYGSARALADPGGALRELAATLARSRPA